MWAKPQKNNMIVCFKVKPNINGLVFNVDLLIKSISQKYSIEVK